MSRLYPSSNFFSTWVILVFPQSGVPGQNVPKYAEEEYKEEKTEPVEATKDIKLKYKPLEPVLYTHVPLHIFHCKKSSVLSTMVARTHGCTMPVEMHLVVCTVGQWSTRTYLRKLVM